MSRTLSRNRPVTPWRSARRCLGGPTLASASGRRVLGRRRRVAKTPYAASPPRSRRCPLPPRSSAERSLGGRRRRVHCGSHGAMACVRWIGLACCVAVACGPSVGTSSGGGDGGAETFRPSGLCWPVCQLLARSPWGAQWPRRRWAQPTVPTMMASADRRRSSSRSRIMGGVAPTPPPEQVPRSKSRAPLSPHASPPARTACVAPSPRR